jgi:hypothetical protein
MLQSEDIQRNLSYHYPAFLLACSFVFVCLIPDLELMSFAFAYDLPGGERRDVDHAVRLNQKWAASS